MKLNIILFLFSTIFCFSQMKIEKVVKYECVSSLPLTLTIFEDPRSNPSYRTLMNDFVNEYPEYDPIYWTMANYVYPTADDAYNNANAYPRDRVARSVSFDISNPANFFLRLEENVFENQRIVIIHFQYNYSIQPSGRNNFEVIGCEIDNENNVYNLDKALFDIYSFNHYYEFSFYQSHQDAILERNPIPDFDWENYTVSNTVNSVYLKVKYLPSYSDSPCSSIFKLLLNTKEFDSYLPDKSYTFCGVPFKINGPFDLNNVYQFSNFEWYHDGVLKSNNFNVNIDAIGEWVVYFDISTGCRSFLTINVTEENGEGYIKNIRSSMSQIIIEPNNANLISGYSLDGIIWQESNVFNNSTDLIFSFYFKNNQGCVFGPFSYDVSNFFTFISPNSDGFNDKWDIRSNLKLEENDYSIQIFDRNGKILAEGKLKDILPWDGFYNNRKLATGAYWYRIFKDKVEVKSGSILLKN